MKRKIFSKLLMGAFLIASISSFVSCKDYDDDIKSINDKLATVALQTTVDNLQSQLQSAAAAAAAAQKTADQAVAAAAAAQATANDAATKVALSAVEATAKAAGEEAAKAIANAATAQTAAEAAQKTADQAAEAAKAAQEAADKAAAAATAGTDAAKADAAAAAAAAAAAQKVAEEAAAAAAKAATDNKSATDAAAAVAEAAKAAADDVTAKIAGLEAQVATAQSTAEAAQKAAEAAQKAADLAAGKEVDLSNYVTKADLTAALKDYAKAVNDYVTNDKLNEALTPIKEDLKKVNDGLKKIEDIDFEKVKKIVANYENSIAALFVAVTEVSLVDSQIVTNNGWSNVPTSDGAYSMGWQQYALVFKKLAEQKNTWPASGVATAQYTFTKGKYHVGTQDLYVRVSPSTATLTTSNVALINSLGQAVPSDIVRVKSVSSVDWKMTRAGENNGLWRVTLELNENYAPAQFDAVAGTSNGAMQWDATNNVSRNKQVLFAVAVNNTANTEGAENRRAVSSYDVTLYTDNYAYADLSNTYIKGATTQTNNGWTALSNIRNRWNGTASTENAPGGAKEYFWKAAFNPSVTPDYNNSDASKINVQLDGNDNRSGKNVLEARVGEPIQIAIDYVLNSAGAPWYVKNAIRGFYVTLDKAFAETSNATSEGNAWEYYQYENVGYTHDGVYIPAKLQDGNFGSITIKNLNNVVTDIIGFRIYAVNHDGTLLDPDGKAFYVNVKSAYEEDAVLNAEIIATDATTAANNFVVIPINGEFKTEANKDTKIASSTADNTNWVLSSTGNAYKVDGNLISKFNVAYAKNDKGDAIGTNDVKYANVKYLKVSLADLPNTYEDNKTYQQYLELKAADNTTVIKTVKLNVTKKLPAFPAKFAFKSAVNHDGNSYTAFFNGKAGGSGVAYDDKVGTSNAAYGQYLPETTFNGVANDNKYIWEYSNSKDNDGSKAKPVSNSTTNAFEAQTAYIDNKTSHTLKVSYNWGKVSAYKKADGTWKTTDDYKVEYPGGTFTVKYADWHYAATYTPSTDLYITWGNPTATVNLGTVAYVNTYNGVAYGTSLGQLIDNGYLTKPAAGSAKFRVVGSSIDNEHLELTDDGSGSYFTKKTFIDVPANAATGTPAVTHDEYYIYVKQINWNTNINAHTENVTLTLKDVYGHNAVVTFQVHVKAAGTARQK